jgi:uncharacterized protein YdaU (DUF1376 family)
MSAPLTPADCDLRDFDFMTLDVRRLLKSETWMEAADDPRLGHALMTLWAESWHQVPAASVPNNDRLLARLAMCTPDEWQRIRARALSGWVLCDDGRYYHPVVAEKAADAYERKGEFRQALTNKSARQKRWRERYQLLAAELRQLGQTPPAGASLQRLEELIRNAKPERDATVDASGEPASVYIASPETAWTGTGTVDIQSSASDDAAAGSPDLPSADTAMPDWKTRLFREGVPIVERLTGKPTSPTRTLIGKWLKSSRDDCRRVLRILEDARDANPIDPVAWIEAALRGQQPVASHEPNSWRM